MTKIRIRNYNSTDDKYRSLLECGELSNHQLLSINRDGPRVPPLQEKRIATFLLTRRSTRTAL